jgi:hypothetical protein
MKKDTTAIASTLFALAFLGTTIYAMILRDFTSLFIGASLTLLFLIVAIIELKNN